MLAVVMVGEDDSRTLTLYQCLKMTLVGNCDVFETSLSIPYNHATATAFLVYNVFKTSFKDPGGTVRVYRKDSALPVVRRNV